MAQCRTVRTFGTSAELSYEHFGTKENSLTPGDSEQDSASLRHNCSYGMAGETPTIQTAAGG